MNYIEPENLEEIIEEIKRIPDIKGIVSLINRLYPDWLVTSLDHFSKDYDFLNTNWAIVCATCKTKQSQILIVDYLSSENKLICIFAELLTQAGFCVRTKNEFNPCSDCFKVAIPSKHLHSVLTKRKKDKPDQYNDIIPDQYNEKCLNCRSGGAARIVDSPDSPDSPDPL